MHRIDARRFAVPLLVLFAALTAVPVRSGDHPAANKINEKIADFSLQTADGKPTALHDFKDKKAVVVVFLSFDCPVSTSYAPDLAAMAKNYAGKGVAFLGVDGSDEGDDAAVAKRGADFNLPFPVLKDDAPHRGRRPPRRSHAGSLRPRRRPRPPLPRPHRRRLLRPPQAQP